MSEVPPTADRPRIAIVDDDPSYLAIMVEVLEDQGYDAVAFDRRRSRGTVAELSDARPDLVICDLRMERADSGWSLIEQLQTHPDLEGIRLIVCSADVGQLRDRQEWLAARGIGTLVKPFDLDALFDLVVKQLATYPS